MGKVEEKFTCSTSYSYMDFFSSQQPNEPDICRQPSIYMYVNMYVAFQTLGKIPHIHSTIRIVPTVRLMVVLIPQTIHFLSCECNATRADFHRTRIHRYFKQCYHSVVLCALR